MTTLSFYSSLTIPAGTAVLSPISQEIAVVPGRAILLRLFIPPGPRGEINLWFKHQQFHLAPAGPGTWDKLDNITLEVPLDFLVEPGEAMFSLFGSSPQANFSHTVDFELQIAVTDKQAAALSLQFIKDRIANLLGGE